MTKAKIAQHALSLPENDRFELAHALWASLNPSEASQQSLPLPEWQRQLLDKRLQSSAGEEGEAWEQVRANIWPEAP